MKIGIVSLGLIGGSLFKCLTRTQHEIYAVTRNDETIKKAKKYTQNVSNDINLLSDCEVVFCATPINKTIEMLDKLENVVSNNCIVMDCASVKEFIIEKKRPYKFIGSHPMAGTEFSGFDAGFKELFMGAKWVLTPTNETKEEDILIAEKIIKETGAEPIIANAKEHDIAVALISHMPMFISQSIFKTAMDNKLALKLASSGFRDMTRLAMGNTTMANDMLTFNKDNINNCLEMLQNSIESLNNTKYLEIITDIKDRRSSMYSSEGKNIL